MKDLREQVFLANLALPKYGLVTFTWGNVSGIDREKGIIIIKPSGVSYDEMKASDMVALDLEGNVIEGKYKPSSDTPTHVELYKAFPDIKGVVHTHSSHATAYAQAIKPIPAYGTTHADYFYGDIPCTRVLTEAEVLTDYEKNTGIVIVDTFKSLDYKAIPAVLAANHGVFTWGGSPDDAVHNAVVLEEIAKMGINTQIINNNTKSINEYILDKHYFRKHGKGAYYGQ